MTRRKLLLRTGGVFQEPIDFLVNKFSPGSNLETTKQYLFLLSNTFSYKLPLTNFVGPLFCQNFFSFSEQFITHHHMNDKTSTTVFELSVLCFQVQNSNKTRFDGVTRTHKTHARRRAGPPIQNLFTIRVYCAMSFFLMKMIFLLFD